MVNFLIQRFRNFPKKIRIFLPIVVGIVISIFTITLFSIQLYRKDIYRQLEKSLRLEVKTLMKMLERERALKLEQAKNHLQVFHDLFYTHNLRITDEPLEMTAINQESGLSHRVVLNKWYMDGELLQGKNTIVDRIRKNLEGSTATIFQKIDGGYLRISTNVAKLDGSRAVGTFIPDDSPVIKTIEKGETYTGRAFVVNDWYTAVYEPVFHKGGIVGIIYVGLKEKDLDILRSIFSELKIGKSGYPFVFDQQGNMLIHPRAEGEKWSSRDFVREIVKNRKGIIRFSDLDGQNKIVAYDYFADFKYYIAAMAFEEEEAEDLISKILRSSIIISVIFIVILSLLVYFTAIEKMHKYLEKYEVSREKLHTTREALKQSEKLASMGQLSAGIAHEVNNPLGVVLMYSHLLMDEADKDSDFYSDLQMIASQADRCKNILSGLLNFARKNQVNKAECNITELVASALKGVVVPAKLKISVEHRSDNHLVFLDTDQFVQVISNLVKNAIEAMKGIGEIKIASAGDNERFTLEIVDDGPGIPAEFIDKLFEPFFTTKGIGKGTGLGLAVCYGIVKMHQGQISVESSTDKDKGETGTKFFIDIPRYLKE